MWSAACSGGAPLGTSGAWLLVIQAVQRRVTAAHRSANAVCSGKLACPRPRLPASAQQPYLGMLPCRQDEHAAQLAVVGGAACMQQRGKWNGERPDVLNPRPE